MLLLSKTMALVTFMKATKTRLDSLPSAATRVPFEVCCEFPGCEKDIYKASTACSGTEDISPRGQLNKWQSSPAAASCKRESHQFTGFRWLRQKPPGRKSCCANLFPCCFLCCKFFAETIHLLRSEGTEFCCGLIYALPDFSLKSFREILKPSFLSSLWKICKY